MPTTYSASFLIGGVQFGPTLSLARLPLFLRFVVVGDDWQTLDALDRHDDVAKPEETIIAAKQTELRRAHFLRTPRSASGWHNEAVYEMTDPQPAAFDLRDTPAWRAWCIEQDRKAQTDTPTTEAAS